jgi:hypothetical protein
MNNGCPTHGWAIIGSAPMDSQLAGVLAGFVFTGIVLLFGRRGSKNTQALGLFCAVFIALGFDSHLFGVVSGESPDPFCGRVWAQEMICAGLLGVSAMAIVTGLSWLLASHLDEVARHGDSSDLNDTDKVINLDRLVRFMAYGTGVTVTLLLAATTYDYLPNIYKTHIPAILIGVAVLSPLFVLVASIGITSWRAWYTRRNPRVTHASMANKGLQVAAYGILCYAVVGPVSSGVISELGADWWQPPSGLIVCVAIIAGLGVPAMLMIALVQAVPPLFSRPLASQPISTAESDSNVVVPDLYPPNDHAALLHEANTKDKALPQSPAP